jgi:hypothetical protein
VTRSGFRYQPFYCEENVWQLLGDARLAERAMSAVFVSNAAKSVAMWHQRAAPPGETVVWDYHVTALAEAPLEIWDLDTDLGLPVPLSDYLEASFGEGPPELAPSFRVVERDELFRTFASDRAHMKDARGRFVKPPPPWPAIGGPDAVSNLMRFVEMNAPFAGEVRSLESMLRLARGI